MCWALVWIGRGAHLQVASRPEARTALLASSLCPNPPVLCWDLVSRATADGFSATGDCCTSGIVPGGGPAPMLP